MSYIRMFVKTNYTGKNHVTPGKEYEVIGYHYDQWNRIGSGWIRNDNNDNVFIRTGYPCEYLHNDGVWKEVGWRKVHGNM